MIAERYPPYFEAWNGSPIPPSSIPGELASLVPTLKALGASYEIGAPGRLRPRPSCAPDGSPIPASLRRPPPRLRIAWVGDMRYAVDRDMESSWTSVELRKPGMWVQLDLGQPSTWAWSVSGTGTRTMALRDGHSCRDERGRTRVARSRRAVAVELLYWSGPRVYPWEWGYRWEARFPPVDGPLRPDHPVRGGRALSVDHRRGLRLRGPGARGRGGRRRAGCPPAHPRSGARPRVRGPLDERRISESSQGRDRDGHTLHRGRAGLLRAVEQPGDPVGRAEPDSSWRTAMRTSSSADDGTRASIVWSARTSDAWVLFHAEGPRGGGRARATIRDGGGSGWGRAHRPEGQESLSRRRLAQTAYRDGTHGESPSSSPGRPWWPTRPITTPGAC